MADTHAAQDIGNAVADSWGRGEGEVDDAEGDAKACCGFLSHELPYACYLERRTLYCLAESLERCQPSCSLMVHLLQGILDDTGT